MEGIKQVNTGLRFLLELAALFILGYWGVYVVNQTWLKIILGIGIPVLAACIWGAFGSPKAPYVLTGFSRLFLEVVFFGISTLALYGMGKHSIAIFYGLISLINLLLLKIWRQ